MEISGKIIAVLEARSGQSAKTGSMWMSQEYVLETSEQYPKRMCFNVWGEDKIRQFGIQVGQELTVSFDIDAREYQGRWYNSLRAWKVEPFVQGAIPQPATAAAPVSDPFAAAPAAQAAQTFENTESQDDLPF
ncbi:MAG: DUF3127 domain-containing protein [Bacteroidaceae bacterium]|jgi:hypothetical protein|nr:DUF3127 domain-containing protein [Bacteroidaceae bacterium]